MARLDKTLIDYLVIAISPALIMTLVGSLVLFLLNVFYRGNFSGRLEIIFSLFVFAAVLIARIAIEESRERAMLFAVPLGFVTLVAIMRFVQFQGSLQAFSFFINCGLIALIWWSANKLTWDCTMIDEDAEDSGEGLMEAVGLEKSGKAAIEADIASTTRPQPAAAEEKPHDKPPLGWWQRFLEKRHRPHAPGVWVVYFSLAALPLFGIGQFFIPAANQENRQYAFQLLFVYTASGLGLLLATSFLGLRRYLRQRRQVMPLPIVNLWLGIGAALIVAAMFIAMILPRTNAEYDLSDVAIRIGSPDQESSQYAVGQEGVEENQPDAQGEPREGEDGSATTDQPSDQTDSSQSDENGKEGKSSSEGQSQTKDQSSSKDQSQSDDSNKAKNDQAKKKSSDKSDKSKSDKSESDKSKSDPSESNQSSEKSSEESSEENQSSEKSNSEKSKSKEAESKTDEEKEKQKRSKSSGGSSAKKESSERKQNDGQRSSPSVPRPSMPRLSSPAGIAWLLNGLKWIFYGVLAIIVVWAIWRNREALWKGFCDFVQFFIDLWNNLFGGGRRRAEAEAEAAAAKKRLPRFTDFEDPFASGVAGRYPPAELVRYTFEAFEAWARDRGSPREPDQTPHEFVRTLAANTVALGPDAIRLAELYCQVAYAPFHLPPESVARLSQLWQIMRSEAVPVAVASSSEH